MSHLTLDIIEFATDAIITTRDFCGNERTAVMELADDYGVKGNERSQLYRLANFRANKQWNQYQRESGVNEKYLF